MKLKKQKQKAKKQTIKDSSLLRKYPKIKIESPLLSRRKKNTKINLFDTY